MKKEIEKKLKEKTKTNNLILKGFVGKGSDKINNKTILQFINLVSKIKGIKKCLITNSDFL